MDMQWSILIKKFKNNFIYGNRVLEEKFFVGCADAKIKKKLFINENKRYHQLLKLV